ncbi:GGDEF domain-containing protein [Clostridium sp.]|uniref:GGDEF domain-containing protein n=1 Tax=Clostridium sp. TaxID=1506 RepID=UPI001A509DD8|nr:GGDEF domain-containing protein [Clostridium sp.]MBK5234996.1 GGDEF domain-containing protein [Clostridium sp.]
MESTDLNKEYNNYQELMEKQTIKHIKTINDCEKQVAMLTSILDIYKYLNDFQLSKDLYEILSDMIVGILGVSNCTVAIAVKGKLIVMASINHEIGSELDTFSKVDNCMLEYITKNDEIIGAIEVLTAKNSTTQGDTKQFLKLICAQLVFILDNRSLNEKILIQANTDLLTGCCNRRAFYDMIENMRIYENDCCILMFDLDKFKLVNDKYGHEAGDIVLKAFGGILLENTSNDDIVCRYGGEEFVVYLHGLYSKASAFAKAEVIRKVIENFVVIADEVEIKFTSSIGIAVAPKGVRNIQDVIKIADINLFESKKTGRNKSTV